MEPSKKSSSPLHCNIHTNSIQTTGPTQQIWHTRAQGFLNSTATFTGDRKDIMFEAACELNPSSSQDGCNVDQRSFKAYLSRWMAATTLLAPWTADTIMPYLRSSALAATQSCSGGTDGVTCGQRWWGQGWDGGYGVGEQMSALEVIQSNLISRVRGPLSGLTGGTSKGIRVLEAVRMVCRAVMPRVTI